MYYTKHKLPCVIQHWYWQLYIVFINDWKIYLWLLKILTGTDSSTWTSKIHHSSRVIVLDFCGMHFTVTSSWHATWHQWCMETQLLSIPDSKVHGANMGPIWGWQDPGGPHVGPMNFAIWDSWAESVNSHGCSFTLNNCEFLYAEVNLH